MASETLPLLSDEAIAANALGKRRHADIAKVHAVYSSLEGGIRRGAAARGALIPMDDHIVHRGHGVFDTATLANGYLYRLRPHLERFLRSASVARIPHPFGLEDLARIIADVCAATGEQNASIRFWLSAGPGTFHITPEECQTAFYVAVFGTAPFYFGSPLKEASVPYSLVPQKSTPIATIKTTNYLQNALCSIAAHERGGDQGLWVDSEGGLLEFSIAGVVIVDCNGVVRTPATNILPSVTVKRVVELTSELVKAGGDLAEDSASIKGLEVGPIAIGEVYEAREVLQLSGDVRIAPVIELDGRPIGRGVPGPYFRWVCRRVVDEVRQGDMTQCDIVPYQRYGHRRVHNSQWPLAGSKL